MRTAVTLLALPAVLMLAATPSAAIDVPQTREEFVKAVSAGARGVRMETFVVDRGFEEVYRIVQRKAAACLDVTVNRTAYVGYTERSSSDYNPTVRRVGNRKGELDLQVVHRPRGVGHTPPPGGLYVMAVDLKPLAPGRTEVVLYHPSMGFKDVIKSFRRWAAGEDAPCPKLK